MEQRKLGRRAIFPVKLRKELASARKPFFEIIQRLLAPGQSMAKFDESLAKAVGLKDVTSKQVRYGNRSYDYAEWGRLKNSLEALSKDNDGLKQAVDEVLAAESIFLRPFADEDHDLSKKGRKPGTKNKKSPEIEGAAKVPQLSDLSFSPRRIEEVGEEIVLTLKGVTISVPKGMQATIHIGLDDLVLTWPR